jgi:hypothetical protein
MTTGTTGERFVEAFLDQDWEEVASQLTDNATYRAITSSGVAQFNDNRNAVAKLESIFEDGDIVTKVETIKTETLPPIERLSYRFQTLIQQAAQLSELSNMCSSPLMTTTRSASSTCCAPDGCQSRHQHQKDGQLLTHNRLGCPAIRRAVAALVLDA